MMIIITAIELFTLIGFNVDLPEGPAVIITNDCEVPILHTGRMWQTWIDVLPKEFGLELRFEPSTLWIES